MTQISFEAPVDRILFGDHRSLTKRGIDHHSTTRDNGKQGCHERDRSNYGHANTEKLTLILLPWLCALRRGCAEKADYKWPFNTNGPEFWHAIDGDLFGPATMAQFLEENPVPSLNELGSDTIDDSLHYFVCLDGNHRLYCHLRDIAKDPDRAAVNPLWAQLVVPFDREGNFLSRDKERVMVNWKNSLTSDGFLSELVACVNEMPFWPRPAPVSGVFSAYDYDSVQKHLQCHASSKEVFKRICTIAADFRKKPKA